MANDRIVVRGAREHNHILDEPPIGLHQRDNGRLFDALKRPRNLGNTVLVVEHDRESIGVAGRPGTGRP